ncbi:MAG TPA: hypothetical protein VH478_13760 [Trebonia sp.]|jgi:hypothetical protein|nr:hypothetical protein [Trebonia sp.]
MALRDKLAQRAQQYLEPGEQVQSVFCVQTGASPYMALVSAWIVLLTRGYYTIAVTDRAIVILRNGWFSGTNPKEITARLPRQPLEQPTGLWGKLNLNGTRYWVHRRFHKDVAAANAAITATTPGAVGY